MIEIKEYVGSKPKQVKETKTITKDKDKASNNKSTATKKTK